MLLKKITLLCLMLWSVSVSAQDKDDILNCLELIFEQTEFAPAFENGIASRGAVVITSDPKKMLSQYPMDKLRGSLESDDFYDFSKPVEVIRSDENEVRRQGIPIDYILRMNFNGTEERGIRFMMSTLVRNENLRYYWNYFLVKIDGEWEIKGSSLDKQRN